MKMLSRNIFYSGVFLFVLHLSVAFAQTNSTNVLSANASVPSTTKAPAISIVVVSSVPVTEPKNVTAAGTTDPDDCSDEVTAEPEGAAKNSTGSDRTAKQLHLGDDKDKYSHEGAHAEPEPESEPTGNSTSSSGKLTGNSTTARPAHGSGTVVAAGYPLSLGIFLAAIVFRVIN